VRNEICVKTGSLLLLIFATVIFVPLGLRGQSGTKNVGAMQSTGRTNPAIGAQIEDQAGDAQDAVPSLDLRFTQEDPVPGIAASPVMVMPVQCSADGSAILDMLAEPDFRNHAIYLIHSGSSTTISLKNIMDLQDIQLVSLSASNTVLAALVYAAKRPQSSESETGRHFYIAKFDISGAYREAIELPIDYQILGFTILSSDEFVVVGFDPVNNVPRLLVLDSNGEINRAIPFPETMRNADGTSSQSPKTDALPATVADGMAGDRAFGSARFTLYGDKVLFWLSGKNAVLEIGEGGKSREVPINPPKGYDLQGFIPSNDRWIAEFSRKGLSSSGPIDSRPETGNFLFYEVQPSDGSLRRRLNLGADQFGWIACEHDGLLTSFKTDDKQRLIPLLADLAK